MANKLKKTMLPKAMWGALASLEEKMEKWCDKRCDFTFCDGCGQLKKINAIIEEITVEGTG